MGPQGVYKYAASLSNSERSRPPIKMKDGSNQQLYSKQTFTDSENTSSASLQDSLAPESNMASQPIMTSLSVTSLQSILTSAKLVTSSQSSAASYTVTSSSTSAAIPPTVVSSAPSSVESNVPTEGDYSNISDEMIMVRIIKAE